MKDHLFRFLVLGLLIAMLGVQAWTLKLQNKTLGQFYSIVDGAKDIKIIVDVESEESLERRNEK